MADYLEKFLKTIKNIDLVHINVFDQNNTDRSQEISKIKNVYYRHLNWDDYRGPNFFRLISSKYPLRYFFSIDDNLIPPYGWDVEFPELISDSSSVISMFGKQAISPSTFGVKVDYNVTSDYSISKFADVGFLFIDRKNLNILENTRSLKVDGISLVLSKNLFDNGITIKSLPSEKVLVLNDSDKDYVPYSKKHNYNLAIKYVKLDPRKEFYEFCGIDFDKISFWPHENNDVLYFNARSSLDRVDNKVRFHDPYNKIYFSGEEYDKHPYNI